MDSVTHIVLGACIGELIAGKRLGKKAMLLGAIAQSIPDVDFVASFWMDTTSDLLAHRGFTHSILFTLLLSPLLGFVSKKWQRKTNLSLWNWTMFWGIQIFIHIFIDSFNAYGTGWLEPFSHQRFTFNTLFVADPLFIIWPLISAVVLLVLKRNNAKRRGWAVAGVACCSLYLVYCIYNKLHIDKVVSKAIENQHIRNNKWFTTPSPLNCMLWFVVIENDSGYHIGYHCVFDKKDKLELRYVLRNDPLLKPLEGNKELRDLKRFSRGYYTAEMWHDTLVFNDLCFEDMAGWQNPDAKFVFHYYLLPPGANDIVVQRGRFAGWGNGAVLALLQRIKGN